MRKHTGPHASLLLLQRCEPCLLYLLAAHPPFALHCSVHVAPPLPLHSLAKLPEVAGCEAKLRMEGDKPYVTDNSNYIVDLYFEVSCCPCSCGSRRNSCSSWVVIELVSG